MLQTADCKWQEAALAAARVELVAAASQMREWTLGVERCFPVCWVFQASLRPAPPRDLGWGAGTHLFSVFRETWHCSRSPCPARITARWRESQLHSVYNAGLGPFAGGQPAHPPLSRACGAGVNVDHLCWKGG